MKKKITIAIDAMGGDNSPDKTISGVGLFVKKNISKDDFIIHLFGNEEILKKKLEEKNISSNNIRIPLPLFQMMKLL